MHKLIICLVATVILLAALIVGTFFISRGQALGGQSSSGSIADMNLGKGGIRLDRPSSITQALALTQALQNKPLPTNKWWTGLTDEQSPQPVFNLPWSTQITTAGLQIGVPKVSATANTISAPMTPDLTIKPTLATLGSAQVTGYDDMSVDVGALDQSGGVAFTFQLVKGLPFEYVTYGQPLEITASNNAFNIKQLADGRTTATTSVNGQGYELVASAGATIHMAASTVTVTPAQQGDRLTIIALPSNISSSQKSQYETAAEAQITGTSSSFKVTGQSVTTTLSYHTADSRQTIHMVIPNQKNAGASVEPSLGQFATIRGMGIDVQGNSIVYTDIVPTHLTSSLPLPAEDSFFQKSKLDTYLQQATTNDDVADTSYNGGKQLFRLANLLVMAQAAGSQTQSTFKAKLYSELASWLTYSPGKSSQYFAYDSRVHGLVGVSPEFFNDDFDDHQLQYGYFLYAASVMAKADPTFVSQYGKVVNLIAADIATTSPNNPNFPRLRVYDPYEGHSWADGLSQFADGNNQESVSEAANAWFGLMQWGGVTHNQDMEQTGEWLYANETAASLTYYYNTGNNIAAFPAPFAHHQVSILWGGKSDWATFFSPAPEAMHIILVMPLSGGSLYLNQNGNLSTDLSALQTELAGSSAQSYPDVLMMMGALADPNKAVAGFNSNVQLDDSNSLAYVYYWTALAEQGKLQ